MSTHFESPVNNPLRSFSISLWNANGLRATSISDVLSHVNTSILFITETWLTAGYLPAHWSQYHLYGTKVLDCSGRGSGGVSALVSTSCYLASFSQCIYSVAENWESQCRLRLLPSQPLS